MRILLTGASGQLGQTLIDQVGAECITPLAREHIRADNIRPLRQLIAHSGAELLIHAAANTDVEGNEAHPNAAWRDNTLLTQILVDACRGLPLKFAYISSTGVYGNHQPTPYSEFDDTRPTTAHHRSKLQAERIVALHLPNHLIARTGWLFGSSAQQPRNFVLNRLREAGANPHMQSNAVQTGNPTWLPDMIDRLLELARRDLTGTYNIVSAAPATRFDFVQAIIAASGLPCQLEPAQQFSRRAPVSDNEAAIDLKLQLLGLSMPDWRTPLPAYVGSLMNAVEASPHA